MAGIKRQGEGVGVRKKRASLFFRAMALLRLTFRAELHLQPCTLTHPSPPPPPSPHEIAHPVLHAARDDERHVHVMIRVKHPHALFSSARRAT
jgi:hypothetical protein